MESKVELTPAHVKDRANQAGGFCIKSIHASNHLLKDASIWQSHLYPLRGMRLGDFLTAGVQDVGLGDRPKRPTKSTRPGHVVVSKYYTLIMLIHRFNTTMQELIMLA